MTHLPPSSDDLAWQASRYCLAEMTADEVTGFEQLLLESQAAREAVASAMELLSVVHRAESSLINDVTVVPIATSASTSVAAKQFVSIWRERSAWIGIGAVAASLVMLLSQVSWQGLLQHGGFGRTSPAEQARLAAMWLENSELAAIEEPETADASDDNLSEHAVDNVGNPPEWMLAAVSQERMPSFEGGSGGSEGEVDTTDGTLIDRLPVEN